MHGQKNIKLSNDDSYFVAPSYRNYSVLKTAKCAEDESIKINNVYDSYFQEHSRNRFPYLHTWKYMILFPELKLMFDVTHANMTIYAQLEDLTAEFWRFKSSAPIVKYLSAHFNMCTVQLLLFLLSPTNSQLYHKTIYHNCCDI